MTRRAASIENAYFDRLYAADPDPWRFASSGYEAEKYAASLAALQDRRFHSAFEIGCSIGIFSRHLATRCERLLSIDVAEAALTQARVNCTELNVTFANRRIPQQWPAARFDLIVFSEVLYYLDMADLERVAELTKRSLVAGGTVLLVHYTGGTDYPLSGDAATEAFQSGLGLAAIHRTRAERYRLDVYGNVPLRSIPV